MKRPVQREWVADVLETIPSVIFLALWRSDVDMQLAGWIGVALAAIQLAGFYLFRVRFNPIMLGINVHLLIITPLIMTAFYMGAREFSDTLAANSYRGVLVTVFLVGCALTLLSPRGFIGADNLPKSDRWKLSAVLLSASALAILWAFSYAGSTLLAVAAPTMGLFGLRRFLLARTLDSDDRAGRLMTASAGSAFLTGTDADSI